MPSPSPGATLGLTFRAEASRRFADYWFSLPRQGLLPPRTAFDPAQIPSLLPMILLRDVETGGASRYRLVGTGVCELLGEELTAREARTVMPEALRERYDAITRLMFDQPCGLCALLRLTTVGGRSLSVENVGFPFEPTADGRRQTLGLLSPLGGGGGLHLRDEGARLSAIDDLRFIDVGAGVPESSLES